MFISLLTISYGTLSSTLYSVTLNSSGTISSQGQISPLHVEGKYIKDASGNIVILRGVNKEGFEDLPTGVWQNSASWNPTAMHAELDAMKSWNINVVRSHQVCDYWKANTGNYRQHIKDVIAYAASIGMYFIFDFYGVTNSQVGGNQDPLPYPPYQTSGGNPSSIIGSQADFITLFGTVVSELGGYPNVIFDPWNEPCCAHYTSDAYASWKTVFQQILNNARAAGCNNIFLYQQNDAGYVDFRDTFVPDVTNSMLWITSYPVTGTNIVYSTHGYRQYGAWGILSGGGYAYQYNDILQAFQYEKIDWVGNTLNAPLLYAELGCWMDLSGTSLAHEETAFTNALSILNSWNLGYLGFWWYDFGPFRLLSSGTTFTPTDGGTILKNAIINGTG
jgi:hypothetical protein